MPFFKPRYSFSMAWSSRMFSWAVTRERVHILQRQQAGDADRSRRTQTAFTPTGAGDHTHQSRGSAGGPSG